MALGCGGLVDDDETKGTEFHIHSVMNVKELQKLLGLTGSEKTVEQKLGMLSQPTDAPFSNAITTPLFNPPLESKINLVEATAERPVPKMPSFSITHSPCCNRPLLHCECCACFVTSECNTGQLYKHVCPVNHEADRAAILHCSKADPIPGNPVRVLSSDYDAYKRHEYLKYKRYTRNQKKQFCEKHPDSQRSPEKNRA